MKTEVVLKFINEDSRVVAIQCLMKTEVVLKLELNQSGKLLWVFNENRSCIEIL